MFITLNIYTIQHKLVVGQQRWFIYDWVLFLVIAFLGSEPILRLNSDHATQLSNGGLIGLHDMMFL